MAKVVRIICNILVALFLVCALGILAVLGIPMLSGNHLFAVQTASMAPTYPVGSIVIVEPVTAAEIQVGDVITFELDSFSSMITHRVLEVNEAEQTFITKGDNNENVDFFPVPFQSLDGRVSYGIPLLGNLVTGIRTTGGIILCLWILFIMVLLLIIPGLVDKRQARKEQEKKQQQEAKAGQDKVNYSQQQARATPSAGAATPFPANQAVTHRQHPAEYNRAANPEGTYSNAQPVQPMTARPARLRREGSDES